MSDGRRPLDAYFTDPRLVRTFTREVVVGGNVLEPCAGTGNIARTLADVWTVHNIWTADIDPQYSVDYVGDAREQATYTRWPDRIDWIVTNPPFNILDEFLPMAWEHCETGMALLLRLSALEPTAGRGAWLVKNQQYLKHIMVFGQPRPQFRKPGRDFVTTAWFVWTKSLYDHSEITFHPGWKE